MDGNRDKHIQSPERERGESTDSKGILSVIAKTGESKLFAVRFMAKHKENTAVGACHIATESFENCQMMVCGMLSALSTYCPFKYDSSLTRMPLD